MIMLWKCTICGFVSEGENAPDICPKCGYPAEKCIQLSEEDGKKIYASDRTNDIHMKLVDLAMKMVNLANEGIEINLDPTCLEDFKKAKKEAWNIKQRSKAEIVTHIGKGKW